MLTESDLERLQSGIGGRADGVLSLYCDINPARPENAGKAWLKRVKNTISEMPELHRPRKHGPTMAQALYELLAEERPDARTLALFAAEDAHGDLLLERFDLQVELPVVDLAHGRVEARFGRPYIAPFVYAFDEYERVGVLHLRRGAWRFWEIFLDEVEEATRTFAELTPQDWEELQRTIKGLESIPFRVKSTTLKDKVQARVQVWAHKFYGRLARLLEKAVIARDMNRLVLLGEDWQMRLFAGYLNRNLRGRIVGMVEQPSTAADPNPKELLARVRPVLDAAERAEEMALLDSIREQPGVWGLAAVLDALQIGRAEVVVLPWQVDQTVWRADESGLFFADATAGAEAEAGPGRDVPLRDHIFDLAASYGTRLEFVRGESEDRLKREFAGVAARLRW